MKERWTWRDALAAGFFLLCAAMTAYYLIAGYGAYLDSDMASELALASHLAKEGGLVSRTWYYSTEIRLINTQMVFTPLMALFPDNWRLVRTLGCMILLGMLAAAAYVCARSLRAKRSYAGIFAGLSLLPCSVVYAQMMVIGAYYIPHAVLTDVFVILLVCMRAQKRRWPAAAALMVLSAIMGASSIRYLLCAVLPAAMAGMYLFVFPENGRLPARRDETAPLIGAAWLAAMAGVLGYVLGTRLLCAMFLWDGGGYSGRRLIALSNSNLFERLDIVLDGLVRLMGYTERRLLFSIQGMLSVGAVLLLLLAGLLVVRCLRKKGNPAYFGALLLAMSALLTLGAFLFVEDLYLNRYWIPVMTLGAPVMAACLSAEDNAVLRRLSVLLFAVVMLGLSATQIRDSMASAEIGDNDRANAQAIEESGLDLGYATFWNANIVTELTHGKVEMVSFQLRTNQAGDGYPQIQMWLEAQENTQMNRPADPVFLLLSEAEERELGAYLALCEAEKEELPGGGLSLYRVAQQARLFKAAKALGAEPAD